MLTTLRFNLANTAIRRETLHGKQYVVAPMAMLTEGVHNGSGGPLLYRSADIKKAAPAWNMKPIVVYHPQINGQGVSACDPDVLEAQQVGMVMRANWNGKLRAEAWIDESRAASVDRRVLDALEQNKLMEVSTGLFTENIDETGEWNGEQYTAIAVNHQPDHLALLPDQIGACSIADGAGLLQLNEDARAAGVVDVDRLLAREMDVLRRMVGNAMSHGNISASLLRALKERFKPGENEYIWVADVYEDKVVYEVEGKGKMSLFSLGYTKTEHDIALSAEEPVPVVRVTEYRTPDGIFVGNGAHLPATNKGNNAMEKKQLVSALIANAALTFTEEDRDTLMALDDGVLNKMMPKEAENPAPTANAVQTAAEVGANGNAPVANQTYATTEEYIAAAPPEIRQLLQNSLATHEAEKRKLIDAIVANKANTFSPEFLSTKDIAELKGLAVLATNGKPAESSNNIPMFIGQAFGQPMSVIENAESEDCLSLPEMTFAP